MKTDVPFVRDLLLVGGGHANVQVLRHYGMRPEPGVRITVVAREPHTPYSGMLPGYLAGKYTWEQIHIDLLKLSTFANARFIPDEVTRVNIKQNSVSFRNRPDLHYDVIAINTGGSPGLKFQDHESVIPVKPIGRFIPKWQKVVAENADGEGCRLVVVGGGPGSVEVALSVRERYGKAFDIHLVTANSELLIEHNRFLRRGIVRELDRNRVEVSYDFEVIDATNDVVVAADGRTLDSDCVLWVAGVEAPDWIRKSGFAVDDRGFLRVNEFLQSVSADNVFAAGDIVCLDGQQRPKSGVYAVREGPFLTKNTRRMLTDRPLKAFRPQKRALAILRLPNDAAIATKGPIALRSKTINIWKDWIDRKFMDLLSDLPVMQAENGKSLAKPLVPDLPTQLRCGGCGAKLGADLLTNVLRRLEFENGSESVAGIGDDAAVVDWQQSRLATSCDGFRAMISDPYQFGRISAHHALNDLYAMGSDPEIALALATVPLMSHQLMEEELYQLMSGAVSVFRECGVRLVGGHSAEGSELSVGFAVTGSVSQGPLYKSRMKTDEAIVLTKPLGTGVILAGVMHGSTTAQELIEAVRHMDQSNADAMRILRANGASAMTDVTGFGLLGHLLEITRRSNIGVHIFVDRVPLMQGTKRAFESGVRSSLHENNAQALRDYEGAGEFEVNETAPLVDPQTCGGLLAAIPKSSVAKCISDLHQAGYEVAAQIGVSVQDSASCLQLSTS